MDNQNQNTPVSPSQGGQVAAPGATTGQPAVSAPAVQSSPAVAAPQSTQPATPQSAPVAAADPTVVPPSSTTPKGSKKGMYIAVAVGVLILGGAAAAGFVMMRKPATQTTPVITKVAPTAVPSPTAAVSPTVTPLPITSTQDVNNALQQIDNTDPSSVNTGLSQNAQDAASFAQ